MRTRTLILTAAALVAGLATSFAQTYSANIVGYATLTLQPGFNLIANQFDLDGNGTNNTVSGVFGTNLPPNSTIYAFNGSGYDIASFSSRSGWDFPNNLINPGRGFWINNPNASAVTVTISGQVLTGTLPNGNVPAAGGFAIVSSVVPQAGLLQTDLGYTPVANDTVYAYNNTGNYDISSFSARSGWSPSEPTIAVGQGFWLSTTGNTWTRTFNP